MADTIQLSRLQFAKSSSAGGKSAKKSKRRSPVLTQSETLSKEDHSQYILLAAEYCAEEGHGKAAMGEYARDDLNESNQMYDCVESALYFMATDTLVTLFRRTKLAFMVQLSFSLYF